MTGHRTDTPDESVARPAAAIVHGFGAEWAIVLAKHGATVRVTSYGRNADEDAEADQWCVHLGVIFEAIFRQAEKMREETT